MSDEAFKVTGSRRFKKATRTGFAMPEWYEKTPPGREQVGIDFVCERKGHKSEMVGQFRMYTYDGAERRVGFDRPDDGGSPEEAGRPQGQAMANDVGRATVDVLRPPDFAAIGG